MLSTLDRHECRVDVQSLYESRRLVPRRSHLAARRIEAVQVARDSEGVGGMNPSCKTGIYP